MNKDFTPLQHSYLIEGDLDSSYKKLLKILQKDHGIIIENNVDFLHKSYSTLNIAEAREIIQLASKKNFGKNKRIFILSMNSMTREAGNALLKTLEEPAEHTHFFIIIPSIKRILATIISRCRVISFVESVISPVDFISETKFISLSLTDRLNEVKNILSGLEKEKITKQDIIYFIDRLIKTQHKKINAEKTSADIQKLKELVMSSKIASYATDPSPSLKIILEYLAFMVI